MGAEWAMVQHGAPSNFIRNEWEEEEVWKAQYEVGSQIQATLNRALQLYKTTDFQISNVSALPQNSSVSAHIYMSSAHTLRSQRLKEISHDKSAELA